MSRSKKGSKGPGHEYWTARPGNFGGATPGKESKRLTHRMERRAGRTSARNASTGADDEGR